MGTLTSYGTSPRVTITRERMSEGKYHKIATQSLSNIQPPSVSTANAVSVAMTKWVQPWPTFNFNKISHPLYDRQAQYTGIPSNRPEFVKDYHFIGIMRCIDLFLSPTYNAYIFSSTSGPWPTPPPGGP